MGMTLKNFLTLAFSDGRVCFSISSEHNQDQLEIKYQSLNPSISFSDVVGSARSVILAGGTMSPVSECPSRFCRVSYHLG